MLTVYVNKDHTVEYVTQYSRTCFLVFLNSAPIYWFSYKQNSAETSTFGAEFCVMKLTIEYVQGLRYKLRMPGMQCKEPAFVYGNNQSLLANTIVPDLYMKKKSNSCTYHFVREVCAAKE